MNRLLRGTEVILAVAIVGVVPCVFGVLLLWMAGVL
jgi:hypothetical protein